MNRHSHVFFTFWGSVAFLLALTADLQAQQWSSASALSTPRTLHTATQLTNGKVLVVGGYIPNPNRMTASVELYDPATGQWSATGNLITARGNHIAVRLLNGKVLVAGGNPDAFITRTNTAELYDPATGAWSPAGNLNVARQTARVTLLADGRVLVSGGLAQIGSVGSVAETAEIYDPFSNVWTPAASMNAKRVLHSLTLLPNGRVLVVGGTATLNGPLLQITAELYDPAANSWTPISELATPRFSHRATLLTNGKVLIASGANTGNSLTTSAELYDPTTGQWSATGNLITARTDHTLTPLANGKVLATSGSSVTVKLKSAELYDPANGTWTPSGELSVGRANHMTVLLPNGKVLTVAGSGDAGAGNPFSSTELYDSGEQVVATVSGANYLFQIAPKEIVSAFGQNFSTSTVNAIATPLPTSLAGVSVKVKDLAGFERLAPLFFVSPTQINYQIPDGTALGSAIVTVTASDGRLHNGLIEALPTALSIFTTNQQGTDAAAALDAITFTPAPFNATRPNGEPNIIAFYSTGLGADVTDADGNVNASVEARIDGQPMAVQYAGRAPGYIGLNQLNLIVPAGVSSGTHTITVTRNHVTANPVTIAIK